MYWSVAAAASGVLTRLHQAAVSHNSHMQVHTPMFAVLLLRLKIVVYTSMQGAYKQFHCAHPSRNLTHQAYSATCSQR
jgi:hypothetical protein